MGAAMIGEKNAADQQLRLKGLRLLIVEDEYFIADDLRRHLSDAGAEVIGPVPTIARAEAAIRCGGIDGAVLDLNLHGESAAPVADMLANLGIPFAIATGYGTVPDQFVGVPRCEKPFDPPQLVRLISGWAQTAPG